MLQTLLRFSAFDWNQLVASETCPEHDSSVGVLSRTWLAVAHVAQLAYIEEWGHTLWHSNGRSHQTTVICKWHRPYDHLHFLVQLIRLPLAVYGIDRKKKYATHTAGHAEHHTVSKLLDLCAKPPPPYSTSVTGEKRIRPGLSVYLCIATLPFFTTSQEMCRKNPVMEKP